MVVGWEVDRGERDVAEETGRCTLIQADETKVLYDPEGRAAWDSFDSFCDFSLDLETNLNDFQGAWVRELALMYSDGGTTPTPRAGFMQWSLVVTGERTKRKYLTS